jgi:hypothetical protein
MRHNREGRRNKPKKEGTIKGKTGRKDGKNKRRNELRKV